MGYSKCTLSRRKREFHLSSSFYSSCCLVSLGDCKTLSKKKKKSVMKKDKVSLHILDH